MRCSSALVRRVAGWAVATAAAAAAVAFSFRYDRWTLITTGSKPVLFFSFLSRSTHSPRGYHPSVHKSLIAMLSLFHFHPDEHSSISRQSIMIEIFFRRQRLSRIDPIREPILSIILYLLDEGEGKKKQWAALADWLIRRACSFVWINASRIAMAAAAAAAAAFIRDHTIPTITIIIIIYKT